MIERYLEIYDDLNLKVVELTYEKESQEYGACRFLLNNLFICFRIAKITPTKLGQFVTLWKRSKDGPIAPFDINDPIDLFVIGVKSDTQEGQFIFPKQILFEKGYVSKNGQGGKRAIRVYPEWEKPVSAQAIKTQKWQMKFFVHFSDHSKLFNLYGIKT